VVGTKLDLADENCDIATAEELALEVHGCRRVIPELHSNRFLRVVKRFRIVAVRIQSRGSEENSA
jgi:hypothetical protein